MESRCLTNQFCFHRNTRATTPSGLHCTCVNKTQERVYNIVQFRETVAIHAKTFFEVAIAHTTTRFDIFIRKPFQSKLTVPPPIRVAMTLSDSFIIAVGLFAFQGYPSLQNTTAQQCHKHKFYCWNVQGFLHDCEG